MRCNNCGAKLDEGALFCRKCGTAVPEPKKQEPKTNSSFFKNRQIMLASAAAAVALIVLIVVIVSVASCGSRNAVSPADDGEANGPENVQNAVLSALEQGDGERLALLAKTAEPFLGQHTETFGEGETPAAVMRGYYDGLADGFYAQAVERFGEGFTLSGALETSYYTGEQIAEENRALGIAAQRYAVLEGPLSVDGEAVSNARIVAAEMNGEWKLLVVYLFD